jgi:hypothetical protein
VSDIGQRKYRIKEFSTKYGEYIYIIITGVVLV